MCGMLHQNVTCSNGSSLDKSGFMSTSRCFGHFDVLFDFIYEEEVISLLILEAHLLTLLPVLANFSCIARDKTQRLSV